MKTNKFLSLLLTISIMLGVCSAPAAVSANGENQNVPLCFLNAQESQTPSSASDTSETESGDTEASPAPSDTEDDEYARIIHGIAARLSSEGIVNDGNMGWFLADMAVYEKLYPQRETVLSDEEKQACLDKIINNVVADESAANLAKTIIALRSLGCDARKIYTSDFTELDAVAKLSALVDASDSGVTNEYTLPYVIIALNEHESYATDEQMDYLVNTALTNKAYWQNMQWGPDAATAMLLALAPYYDANEAVKAVVDETIPMICGLQQDNGSLDSWGGVCSTSLAVAAFSALGIDSEEIKNGENSLIDAIMSEKTEAFDGFNPTYNSFSTEQGFRGMLAWRLFKNGSGERMYDFSSNPMNEACASWAENCPVTFNVSPSAAVVSVDDAQSSDGRRFDLAEGSYSYTVSYSGYITVSDSFEISAEEVENHKPKTIDVTLTAENGSGGDPGYDDAISVNIKVMIHDENECGNSYTYKNNSAKYTALASDTLSMNKGQTVYDALIILLDKNDIEYTYNNGYFASIGGVSEFDHGALSGWMFTVDGKNVNVAANAKKLSSDSSVVWFYSDDYTNEKGSETYSSSSSGSSSATYTVKFETNGGAAIKNQSVIRNAKVKEPSAPSREGYVFDGWFIDSEFSEKYDFAAKVTKNITLYAKWSEEEKNIPKEDKKTFEKDTFDDISGNEWYYDAVKYVYENSIMDGIGNEFKPHEFMTRAMLVTVLYRLDTNSAERETTVSFSDVSENAWYFDAVSWAASNGITDGVTDTEFAPEENITREQLAVILYRYAKLKGWDTSEGEDTNILSYIDAEQMSEYAILPLQWACGEGIIEGDDDGYIMPKSTATRAQTALMLMRMKNRHMDID